VEIATNVAHGVRMMRELFFNIALLYLIVAKILAKNRQTVEAQVSFPLAQWHHIYAQTVFAWRHRATGFFTRCGALRMLQR